MKKFAAPEGQVLPVLSLCLSSRLEKVLGAGLPAVDLNEAMLGKDVGILEILPSGKLTQLWKITIFNWKIHYKGPIFNSFLYVYQRVPSILSLLDSSASQVSVQVGNKPS